MPKVATTGQVEVCSHFENGHAKTEIKTPYIKNGIRLVVHDYNSAINFIEFCL